MLRRFLLLVALLLSVLAVPVTGAVAGSGGYEQVVDITFPFAEGVNPHYGDHYDDGRSGGRVHKATDMMVGYGTPVYAAQGGLITYITEDPSSHGWHIEITGIDGREYQYIHLGRDDRPRDEAYAKGMTRGAAVQRGQLVGYAGCSGNASCGGGEHLHFEIHDPDVTDPYGTDQINPVYSLEDAESRRDYPVRGPFADVSASATHANTIERIADAGITKGCNPPDNTRFCPKDGVTRDQMASFLARALKLQPTEHAFQDVPSGNIHSGAIGAIAEAGITLGCNPPANDRFCPRDTVTREQMASFLTRARNLAPGDPAFADVSSDDRHARSIGAIAKLRITSAATRRTTTGSARRTPSPGSRWRASSLAPSSTEPTGTLARLA